MTTLTDTAEILQQLDDLCTELADLAFQLERRGRCDAADLAIAVSGRLTELRAIARNEMSETKRVVR